MRPSVLSVRYYIVPETGIKALFRPIVPTLWRYSGVPETPMPYDNRQIHVHDRCGSARKNLSAVSSPLRQGFGGQKLHRHPNRLALREAGQLHEDRDFTQDPRVSHVLNADEFPAGGSER
ncbi:hypothetical protein Plec18167_000714 [Paecilomyces lecythidis]|uniref:Uncharacterized protein n=1 Tax=Paecilomyces lecythidis TaxID=3004212 RepID=A0ABR3YEQ8_9EURO